MARVAEQRADSFFFSLLLAASSLLSSCAARLSSRLVTEFERAGYHCTAGLVYLEKASFLPNLALRHLHRRRPPAFAAQDGWAVRVDDFRAFISNASAILKAAAPKQLTCNGMEGDTAWFSRGQATVLSQYDSKIDFVTSHVWPMNWKWFGPRTDEEEGAFFAPASLW